MKSKQIQEFPGATYSNDIAFWLDKDPLLGIVFKV